MKIMMYTLPEDGGELCVATHYLKTARLWNNFDVGDGISSIFGCGWEWKR